MRRSACYLLLWLALFALASRGVGEDYGIAIMTWYLPDERQTEPYTAALAVKGGIPPYRWSIIAGHLPPGLSLNANSGVIDGTSTSTGRCNFTVRATDANSSSSSVKLSITVNPAIYITPDYVPSGLPNVDYSARLSAEGGTPPYEWSIVAGKLPKGLSLNASSGTISGAPRAIGTSKFRVHVTDSKSISTTYPFRITINRSLFIATTVLPSSTGDVSYRTTIEVTGGEPPYTWGLPPVGLPRGLSFSATTGVISGTPGDGCGYWEYWETSDTTFTCDFPVQVTDSNSDLANRMLSITVKVAKPFLKITTGSLPAGLTNIAYYEQLSAAGGTPPYTWSIVAGSLPPALALDPQSGLIGGSPTMPETSYFTVQVTDADSATATRRLGITISEVRPRSGPVVIHP